MATELEIQEATYLKLEEKFPNIKYVEGEDLNLKRARLRLIKFCIDQKRKFKSVENIAKLTGISPRSIHQIISEEKLES